MPHPIFHFHAPLVAQHIPAFDIMCNILKELSIPVRVHFTSAEDLYLKYGVMPLGFHVGVPETDDSFHDMESFFNYIIKNKLWEEKV